MKQIIKRLIFGTGIKTKTIKAGIAKGIIMDIDMSNKLQRYFGLDENEIQAKFKLFSQNCDTFIDIGASDGNYGLIYRKFNAKGKVLLFDADSNYISIQKRNFQYNEFNDNVEYISKYVSTNTTENTVSLDDVLYNREINGIFFKVDVDGGELLVLQGIVNTLRKSNCKLIIETHSKSLEDDCLNYLNALGYKCSIIKNAWWRQFIPEKRPIEHNRWFAAEI